MPWSERLVRPVDLPDGRKLLSLSGSLLKIWDVKAGTLLHRLEGHGLATDSLRYEIVSLAVSPDGRRAITGAADRKVWMWDIRCACN